MRQFARPGWTAPRTVASAVAAAGLALLAAVVNSPETGLGSVPATDRTAAPYPLDGWERTGIRRLEAYRRIAAGEMPGNLRLPPGARLGTADIRLRMRGAGRDWDITDATPRDPELQAGLERIVGPLHPSYRVALVDITDPEQPRYAGLRDQQGYIPGSVGKLLVMTGLFDQLRRLHPRDLDAREATLRTEVVADGFVVPNSHEVPVVADDWSRVVHRAIRVGDVFSLWEWVDHMVSPSSNAAGSTVWKEAMLMDAFGAAYPPSEEVEAAWLAGTPRTDLTERSIRVVEDPLLAAGLDTARLKVRTFFTRGGSRAIPGRGSLSTPRQLVRWLLRVEQGRLVDEWSSREMKWLLYYTRRRYRYAASPALDSAAVYFKSGSLYRCVPEEGYECGQYRGNAQNLMHSVAIVESPAGAERPRVYLISMMSDVPKVNSAAEHATIATRVERLLRELHPPAAGKSAGS